MNLPKLCSDACELIKTTGAFIRKERITFSNDSIEYKGHNDMVSFVDKGAEKLLVEGLLKLLPEGGFITEEKTVSITGKTYNWIIDPLDGTTNFIHGLPCYCISVGLMEAPPPPKGGRAASPTHAKEGLSAPDEIDGKLRPLGGGGAIILGIIYEINQDECFYAWQNGGAFLNGKSISVSKVSHLKDSLLATGFPYSNYKYMKQYMMVFDYLMYNTHGLRRLGSAAADLAYVACGRLEGFYEYGLNSWDVAAGVIIVTEAGGKISDFKGGNDFIFGREIVACNNLMYDEFYETVRKAFADNA